MDFPSLKEHEIKCLKNKNDFTVYIFYEVNSNGMCMTAGADMSQLSWRHRHVCCRQIHAYGDGD